MRVAVVVPPAPVVALAMAKAHLRVDGDDSDQLIAAYVAAATAHIDGPDGWLGRAIGPQTLRATFNGFGDCLLPLPQGPLIDIVSIKYDDGDGVEQTVSPADYTLDRRGALRAFGTAWPSARAWPDSVRIIYRAGYVADVDADPLVASPPPAIVAAILLMTGDLFSNRETGVIGTISGAVQMSTTVENLLAPYRVWTP